MLKDTLAMLALHPVARPWAETIAWTVNLRAPRMNLFVTGSSFEQAITGRHRPKDIFGDSATQQQPAGVQQAGFAGSAASMPGACMAGNGSRVSRPSLVSSAMSFSAPGFSAVRSFSP